MNSLKPFERVLDPNVLRQNIIRLAKYGSSGHIGCSLSLVNIVSVLYSHFIRIDWQNPQNPTRDRLALSKGHGVMALYACFREFGWLTEDDFKNYYNAENKLKGLSSVHVPHVEVSGGSLGQGITVAVGMAKAVQLKNEDARVYCIVGDGECNEGSVWESLMFAAHHKLNNFVVIVDNNKLQAMGYTSEVIDLGDLSAKFNSFGFETLAVDGHNDDELFRAFNNLTTSKDNRPKALIANTIKGKGVSFIENNNQWHYKRLTEEEFETANKELVQ
jgi:transketolase